LAESSMSSVQEHSSGFYEAQAVSRRVVAGISPTSMV
jgi:hypothetical protein